MSEDQDEGEEGGDDTSTGPGPFRRWIERAWTRKSSANTAPEVVTYLREDVVKGLPRRDFDVIYSPEAKAWIGKYGYYHTWRLDDGRKFLSYAQSPAHFDDKNLLYVKDWNPEEAVPIGDIRSAITAFEKKYERARIENATLYGTSHESDHYRSNPIAYRRVGADIIASLNEVDANNLANAYGDKRWERLIRAHDEGVNLSRIVRRFLTGEAEGQANALQNTNEGMRNLVFAHYLESVAERHLKKKIPIHEDDQKLQPTYYPKAKLYWGIRTVYKRAIRNAVEYVEEAHKTDRRSKRYLRVFEEAAKGLLIGTLYLSPLILLEVALTALEIKKSGAMRFVTRLFRKKREEKREIYEHLKIRSPLNTIIQPVKPEIFDRATALGQATFGGDHHAVLYRASSPAIELMARLAGPDSHATLYSLETYTFCEDDPTIPLDQRIHSRRTQRSDGLVITETIQGDHVFLSHDPSMRHTFSEGVLNCGYSESLAQAFSQGKMVHLNLSSDAQTTLEFISVSEAIERMERLGVQNPATCVCLHPSPALDLIKQFRARSLEALLPVSSPEIVLGSSDSAYAEAAIFSPPSSALPAPVSSSSHSRLWGIASERALSWCAPMVPSKWRVGNGHKEVPPPP